MASSPTFYTNGFCLKDSPFLIFGVVFASVIGFSFINYFWWVTIFSQYLETNPRFARLLKLYQYQYKYTDLSEQQVKILPSFIKKRRYDLCKSLHYTHDELAQHGDDIDAMLTLPFWTSISELFEIPTNKFVIITGCALNVAQAFSCYAKAPMWSFAVLLCVTFAIVTLTSHRTPEHAIPAMFTGIWISVAIIFFALAVVPLVNGYSAWQIDGYIVFAVLMIAAFVMKPFAASYIRNKIHWSRKQWFIFWEEAIFSLDEYGLGALLITILCTTPAVYI